MGAVGTVRCCGKGPPDAPPLLFPPLLLLSFLLPQNDINEPADERQRERRPGQNVGVAELCAGVRGHHGVDDPPAHHKHT